MPRKIPGRYPEDDWELTRETLAAVAGAPESRWKANGTAIVSLGCLCVLLNPMSARIFELPSVLTAIKVIMVASLAGGVTKAWIW